MDETLLAVIDSLGEVSVGMQSWPEALKKLAQATGGQGGQLIGLRDGVPLFHWVGDPEPDWVLEAERLGAVAAATNPRLSLGARLPLLTSFSDDDLLSPSERRKHNFYTEVLPRFETPNICAAKVFDEPQLTVALAVVRTRAQGNANPGQRRGHP